MAARSVEGGTGTEEREIVVSREIDAPRERVFEAWTRPEALDRWMGPRGFTTTTHAMDFREGGVSRYTMRGPDGTDYPNDVLYTRIDAPALLEYDHGADDGGPPHFHTVVTFDDLGGGRTRVTLRSVFPTPEARAEVMKFGAVEGGRQTLERLGEFLAGR